MQDYKAHIGLFENECLLEVLQAQWFADLQDEGVKFHAYFNPIPLPTIALVFTAVSTMGSSAMMSV
jgi:Domain of unknown function (DUF6532)